MVKTREISVMTWNLQDGLSDPSRADALAEKIAESDPDVAIFSEGAVEGHGIVPSAKRTLESHAGRVFVTDYMDIDGRADRHRLVAVAKPEFGKPAALSVFGRNGFFFTEGKLPLKIAGFHGFDRDQGDVGSSDEARIRQVRHALFRLSLDTDSQAMVLGDLSAMHPRGLRAAMLRAGTPLFDAIPAGTPGDERTRIARFAAVSQRLARMAVGGSLAVLHEAGFVDADRHHHPTARFGPVAVQLDHVMGKRVELFGHEHIDADGLSSHSGITTKAHVFVRKRRTP